MNVRVNLIKRVNTSEGMRYCPPFSPPTDGSKPDGVFVDGKEVRHPEGAYYIDYTDGKPHSHDACEEGFLAHFWHKRFHVLLTY
jgi:hypothetical protein